MHISIIKTWNNCSIIWNLSSLMWTHSEWRSQNLSLGVARTLTGVWCYCCRLFFFFYSKNMKRDVKCKIRLCPVLCLLLTKRMAWFDYHVAFNESYRDMVLWSETFIIINLLSFSHMCKKKSCLISTSV